MAVRGQFPIAAAVRRLRRAVAGFADAAMFELRDGGPGQPGYPTLFQQLVACIISIRTRDETSLPVSRRLFARASTPEAIARLDVAEIDALIAGSTFHEPKARQIHEIAVRVAGEMGGELPPDVDVLTSFRGVGPKCANLALGVTGHASSIAVDVHVHRVTNRWGYVHTTTPEATMRALEDVLPERYWVEINRLLVPFGKHVCTAARPKCSTCPLLEWCAQIGVVDPR